MKWEKPLGSTQTTTDGRYCIVAANSRDWVAYAMAFATATELGVRDSDLKARACCEAEEARLMASLKRRA